MMAVRTLPWPLLLGSWASRFPTAGWCLSGAQEEALPSGKKKKKKENLSAFLALPLLVGVVLPLWAQPPSLRQLTHRYARKAASCVGEAGGPRPST
jgi:hypothetical protein